MTTTLTKKEYCFSYKTINQPATVLDVEDDSDNTIEADIMHLIIDKRNNAINDSRIYLEPKNQIIEKQIDIKGVNFKIEFEDGEIILSHNKWSLIGSGVTLYDAICDLLSEANNILKNYLELPISKMTFEAIQFREFLLKIV